MRLVQLSTVIATASLVLVGATACSSSSKAAPAGAPTNTGTATHAGTATKKDPCVLVTESDAQTAMGVPVATTQRNDDGIDSVCVYKSADGSNYLQVILVDGGMTQAQFDTGMKSDMQKPVTGVGTDTYFNADTATLATWQNNNSLSIQITDESGNTTDAQTQAAAVKVATVALTRL